MALTTIESALEDDLDTLADQTVFKSQPAFAALQQLSQRVVEQNNARRAKLQRGLSDARARYLQHSILLQTVEQLAVSSCNKASMVTNAGDKDTQSSLQEWPHLDVPVAESLNKHLQVALVSQRLAIPSSGKCPQEPDVTLSGSTSHMLGVRPEDLISATLPPEAKAQALHLQALPAVQAVLAFKAEALGQLVSSSSSSSTGSTLTQGSTTAGSSGTTSVQGLGSVQQQVSARVHGLHTRRRGVYQALHQQLVLCGELLDSLSSIAQRALSFAQDELMDRQSKQDAFQVMLLGEHSASLCHKALLVELQIMSTTYSNPSTCSALRKVHTILTDRASELEQSLSQVSHAEASAASPHPGFLMAHAHGAMQGLSELAAYQDLGPPFQEVVSTYTRLRQELESAQQALTTFTALEDELMRRTG